MQTHSLKIAKKYYYRVASKQKTFEIRKNDRDFQVGDELELNAWEDGEYVLKGCPTLYAKIVYMTDYAQQEDYVVLGIDLMEEEEFFKQDDE